MQAKIKKLTTNNKIRKTKTKACYNRQISNKTKTNWWVKSQICHKIIDCTHTIRRWDKLTIQIIKLKKIWIVVRDTIWQYFVEQHSRLFTSYLQYFRRFSGLLLKLSMLSLRRGQRPSIVRINTANGMNVREITYVLITFQEINTDLMKGMRNILIIGSSSLTSFSVLRSGRSDWLDPCISSGSLPSY